MSFEGLRKGAAQAASRSGGKGKTRSAFFARWKPVTMTPELKKFLSPPPNEESVTEISEPVVIIKGQYPDHYAMDEQGNPIQPTPVIEGYHLRSHTFPVTIQPKGGGQSFKSFRDIICSSGTNRHAPQPCVGCYKVDHGAKDSRPRDKWALNMAHLSWYHRHPLVKDGQIQTKQDGSGPVMIQSECETYRPRSIIANRAVQARAPGVRAPKPCDLCQQGAEFVYGEHRVIEVGLKHLKNLLELEDQLGKECLNCGTNIIRMGYSCARCKAQIFDVKQAQGWTVEQVEQFGKMPQSCQGCGNLDLPVSIYECGFNDQFVKTNQACSDPQKTTIEDVVIWIQKEGQNTESEIVVKKYCLLSEFQLPQTPATQGKSTIQYLQEVVKSLFNLEEMYAPDDLDEQARTINTQNPYAAQTPQYAPYGPAGGPMAPPGYAPQGPPTQGYPQPGYAPQPGYGQQYGQQPQQPGYSQPAQGQPSSPYPNMPMPGRPNFGK